MNKVVTLESSYVSHKIIEHYLRAYELITVFPLYVCKERPNEASPAVINDSIIEGAIVSGKDFKIWHVSSYWLFANSPSVASGLLNHIKERHGENVSLNFPLQHFDIVSQMFPNRKITVDHFYILIPSHFHKFENNFKIIHLTTENMNQLAIGNELISMLGSFEDFQDEKPFYGIVQNDQLVSIGEALVDIGTSAVIQQLYTLEAYRDKGFAKALVSWMSENLLKHNKVPIYSVAEDNSVSIRVAKSIGYELLIRVGCME